MVDPFDTENAVRILLAQYEHGAISLGDMISQLESVPDQLGSRGIAWCASFRESWEKLEEAYASMLDRGEMTPSGLRSDLVQCALREMKQLLEIG